MVQWNYKNEVGGMLLLMMFPAGFVAIYALFGLLPAIFGIITIALAGFYLWRSRKK
ncbi:MAG: hypothetical protein JXB18_08400 [Sedimentisphaerales bacterium]|nr:hypothetical protein [Sedimentisphaerales bacterium]